MKKSKLKFRLASEKPEGQIERAKRLKRKNARLTRLGFLLVKLDPEKSGTDISLPQHDGFAQYRAYCNDCSWKSDKHLDSTEVKKAMTQHENDPKYPGHLTSLYEYDS